MSETPGGIASGIASGLTWLDIAILVVLAFSLALGLWRGFIREVFALIGWIAAGIVAAWFAESAAAFVPSLVVDPRLRWGVAFGAVFLLVLIGASLVSLVASKLIRAAGLGLGDRFLGGLFGVVRGLVIIVIAALIAGMTPLTRDPLWTRSVLTPPLAIAAQSVKPLLPGPIADRVRF